MRGSVPTTMNDLGYTSQLGAVFLWLVYIKADIQSISDWYEVDDINHPQLLLSGALHLEMIIVATLCGGRGQVVSCGIL